MIFLAAAVFVFLPTAPLDDHFLAALLAPPPVIQSIA